MKVWTLKDLNAWQVLKKDGILFGNKDKVFEEFIPAYQWMMLQMQKRLPNYSGNYPVWVWCDCQVGMYKFY